jgi:cell division septation protein DedD
MKRSLVTGVLVLGLAACSGDGGDGEAMKAGILMSMGQRDADLVDADTSIAEPVVATDVAMGADTPDHVPQHDLSSRIFDMPEGGTAANMPFDDLSIFDVTASATTGPTQMQEEGLLPMAETPFEPMEDVVVGEAPTEPAPRTHAGVTRAGYQIQLGALPSEDSARREWVRIESRHPDLVVNRTPDIIPVQLSSQPGTVYRLRTGPFGQYKAAQSLCDKFKSQDQDCYVVKVRNPG